MFHKRIDTKGINEIIDLSKKILKLLFIILCIGILFIGILLLKEMGIFKFLSSILHVLSPLFIGFIIAWLFSPIVSKLTSKNMPRILASIIVYLVFILFLIIFFRIFIPIVYKELNDLINTMPIIIEKITDIINVLFTKLELDNIKEKILLSITNYSNSITSNLPKNIMSITSNLVSGIGTFVFGLVIGLYMLFDFDNISIYLLKIIPSKYTDDTVYLMDNIGYVVRKCVNGTFLVACMVFIGDTIGFSLVGLDSALLFGLFCGITDLIPYIGPWIGTIVVSIIGFIESPITGVLVLIIAIIVQLIESYILQPIVMSKCTNLNPVIIICGLLICSHFFGIIGMILATPIMSIIKVIVEFIIEKINIFKNNTKIKVEEKG